MKRTRVIYEKRIETKGRNKKRRGESLAYSESYVFSLYQQSEGMIRGLWDLLCYPPVLPYISGIGGTLDQDSSEVGICKRKILRKKKQNTPTTKKKVRFKKKRKKTSRFRPRKKEKKTRSWPRKKKKKTRSWPRKKKKERKQVLRSYFFLLAIPTSDKAQLGQRKYALH